MLVRPSNSCSSGLVLSTWQSGKVKHVQIERTDGTGYHIKGGGTAFPSVQQFIDHYKRPESMAEVATIMPSPLVAIPRGPL